MKKIFQIGIGIGIVAVVLIVLMIPAVSGTLVAMISSSEPYCEDAPYDKDCICEFGEEKLNYKLLYYCELEDKVIDPDGNWKTTAETLGEQYLHENFPECNQYDCSQGQSYWETNIGPSVPGGYSPVVERRVRMLCRDDEQGYVFAGVTIDIDDGEITSGWCGDYVRKEEGESEVVLIQRGCGGVTEDGSSCHPWGCAGKGCPICSDMLCYRYGTIKQYFRTYYGVNVECDKIGSGVAEVSFSIPEDETILSVEFDGHEDEYQLISINENVVTFGVPYTCGGGYNYVLTIDVYVEPKVRDKCVSESKYYDIDSGRLLNTMESKSGYGVNICCDDGNEYECTNGRWVNVGTCSRPTQSSSSTTKYTYYCEYIPGSGEWRTLTQEMINNAKTSYPNTTCYEYERYKCPVESSPASFLDFF